MSTAVAAHPPAQPPRFGVLRVIALYKFIKVVLLLLGAWGEIRLHDSTLTARILSWAATRPLSLLHRFVNWGLTWFNGLSAEQIHHLRDYTLLFAMLFAVEGTGLWLQRRWAEWLTVIATASLVPLELKQLMHHPTVPKLGVLIANLAIVGYLGWHVSMRHRTA